MTHPPNVLPPQLLLCPPLPSSVHPHPQRVNRESANQPAHNPHLDIAHIFAPVSPQRRKLVPLCAVVLFILWFLLYGFNLFCLSLRSNLRRFFYSFPPTQRTLAKPPTDSPSPASTFFFAWPVPVRSFAIRVSTSYRFCLQSPVPLVSTF